MSESESVSRMQVEVVLGRMGYALVGEADDLVAYLDRNYPGDPAHYLLLDFSGDRMRWEDLKAGLERDGANINVFLSELESL